MIRFVTGQDPVKLGMTLGSTAVSLGTYATRKVSDFMSHADELGKKAEAAGNLMTDKSLSQASRTEAMIQHVENKVNADDAVNKANATRASRALQKVPPGFLNSLERTVIKESTAAKLPSSALQAGGKVLSKVPWIGVGFTAAGIGWDASQGKSVAKSTTSGASSLVVGSVVGTAIGGPVGTVLGGLAGVGVGFAVDEVWSWFD